MKNTDPLVMFKYRDTKGTHSAQVTTQSKMMKILKSTDITWAVVENLRTGEIRHCKGDMIWKKPSPMMEVLIHPAKQEAFWYGDNTFFRNQIHDTIQHARESGIW